MILHQDVFNNNKQDNEEKATLVVINTIFSATALFDQ